MNGEERHEGEDAGATRWGLSRLFDPGQPVRSAPALWSGDSVSLVVTFTGAPTDLRGAAKLPSVPILAENCEPAERRIVFDHGGLRHRFRILTCDPLARLAILLPPLADALHAAACDAARRMFSGLATAEPAAQMRPSPLQRQRLALMLRVLDAANDGASNRNIGVSLVYPWLAGTDAVAWKATGERRRVQRLLAEARHLAASGYRDLLSS